MSYGRSVIVFGLASAVLAGCVTTGEGSPRWSNVAAVRFVNLQDELTPDAAATLKRAAEQLASHPDSPVLVTGHAYDATSTAHNMARSKARGEAVAAFLETQGVDRARITVDSRGDTDPPIAVQDFAARKRGNRAEVYMAAQE